MASKGHKTDAGAGHPPSAAQSAMERLSILRDLAHEILSLRSPEEIARIALQRIRKIVSCVRASVLLFDFINGLATVLAVESDRPSSIIAPGSHIPLKDVRIVPELYEGHVDIVEDVANPAYPSPLTDYLKESGPAGGIRSFVKVPLIVWQNLIGSLNLWMAEPQSIDSRSIETAREVANSLALAIENARLLKSANRHRRQLQELTVRLTEVEEAERKRLSHELHDQVGPNLTALSINLQFLQKFTCIENNGSALAYIEDALRLVEETAACIRDVMGELRPPVLDDYGLLAALQWFGRRFSRRTGLPLSVAGEEIAPRLPAIVETALFRIFQEALTNIAKHAAAQQVTVTLETNRKKVRMVVSDNGRGFETSLHQKNENKVGWGLTTMRERIAGLGGILRIESHIGHGTRITAEIERKVSGA